MTKFFEEFTQRSNGEFRQLKFNGAEYDRERHELTVRFIISAFESKMFDDSKKKAVYNVVKDIFDGITVKVEYVRTCTDETVVRNKVIEYFNRNQQLLFKRMSSDDILVSVDENNLDVTLLIEKSMLGLIAIEEMQESIKEFLDVWFNNDVTVTLKHKPDLPDEERKIKTDTALNNSTLRLITTKNGQKIYARGKISGLNEMPSYVADAKTESEKLVLCGKVSNVEFREYTNKKYDANNPKSGPEKKTMAKFYLDDTTAKIECVCFPTQNAVDGLKSAIYDGIQVICLGNTSLSTYTNQLSYQVDAIFECSIDFDCIKSTMTKPVPKEYSKVFPTPYKEIKQASLIEEELPRLLRGKTFVIFDFEATDKIIADAEPIELAGVKMVNGVITECFDALIKPNATISEFITNLTSITNEMVSNSPSIEEVLPDFYKFTRGATLVGHNITGYDYPLLKKYADKEGYAFNNDFLDTLLLAREHLKEFKKFDLPTLSQNLGLLHENAHRADSDVIATAELLKVIAKRLP